MFRGRPSDYSLGAGRNARAVFIPSARVGYPFGKRKGKNGKLKATESPQMSLFVLCCARSAFRRTPSGREMVAKPAGNLWQADFHPTATREHQSGNRVISEDIEISVSKYKLNKKHIKYLRNSK